MEAAMAETPSTLSRRCRVIIRMAGGTVKRFNAEKGFVLRG
ncbi:hypothetical protein [Streptomyces collinus]